MAQDTVTITDNTTGRSVDCPVQRGTCGEPVIDVRALHRELGLFTYDPGFGVTASCRSAITYLDGDAGVLLYRGYPIEQLAERSNFLEVSYLLLYGELPTPAQMQAFEHSVKRHTMVHEHLNKFFAGYRYDAHPMSIMVGVMGSMASYYHESTNIFSPSDRDLTAHRVIAKMPNIAAKCHKYYLGQPFVYPDNTLGYVENFMNMIFSVPAEPYVSQAVAVRALDLLLILHADHEQNASTST
ncbi:MAG: citrate (Si)-synthase, partial [Phycisphaerales bacterium]|nr:citrate (Si)-synthase [Phycisphaerales bacterium]